MPDGVIEYSCEEHGDVKGLEVRDLLDKDGKLQIYEEVRKFFEISRKDDKLVLRATRFVGYIPLSAQIAVRVTPKTRISRLIYMVGRAGLNLRSLAEYVSEYQPVAGELEDPERFYRAAFVTALRGASQRGLLKTYRARVTDTELRGRWLPSPSVSRFYARGQRYRHEFEVHEQTIDGTANRILKAVATRLARSVEGDEGGVERARDLSALLVPFRAVDGSGIDDSFIVAKVPATVRALPTSHRPFYERALWLAYLIASHSGVSLEHPGPARLETVVVEVSRAFEGYVWAMCQEAAVEADPEGTLEVFDGNLDHIPLFETGDVQTTKPDVYFRRGSTNVAVADAKYKPDLSPADRYELLAFCEALGVRRAAFVVPRSRTFPEDQFYGRTLGGKEIHVLVFDLDAPDLIAEESRFRTALIDTLGLKAPLPVE